MSRLLEPFQYPFMVDAMVVAVAVGAVCAVLSCFLVLKGWSLMGDAISHAVLPGIVLAYAAGVPLALGAFASGLLCAVATGYIKANSRVKEDTVMGVVFTGFFAFGLVAFTKVKSDLHLDHILFGNVLGLENWGDNGPAMRVAARLFDPGNLRDITVRLSSPGDLRNTLLVGGLTLVIVLALRRDLLLFCFDPGHARTVGLRTGFLYYLLLSLLAMTVVVSLKAVGIILVIAMLVTPGCVGYLLTDRFGVMLAIAVASAVGSALVGVYVSFFAAASPGACIVLVQALVFVVALVLAPKHGLLAGRRRARARSAEAA
jgi:manganese/iron transport system permease protein